MNELRTIVYQVERGRARITLNRPEKLKALSIELMTERNEALWEAEAVAAALVNARRNGLPQVRGCDNNDGYGGTLMIAHEPLDTHLPFDTLAPRATQGRCYSGRTEDQLRSPRLAPARPVLSSSRSERTEGGRIGGLVCLDRHLPKRAGDRL